MCISLTSAIVVGSMNANCYNHCSMNRPYVFVWAERWKIGIIMLRLCLPKRRNGSLNCRWFSSKVRTHIRMIITTRYGASVWLFTEMTSLCVWGKTLTQGVCVYSDSPLLIRGSVVSSVWWIIYCGVIKPLSATHLYSNWRRYTSVCCKTPYREGPKGFGAKPHQECDTSCDAVFVMLERVYRAKRPFIMYMFRLNYLLDVLTCKVCLFRSSIGDWRPKWLRRKCWVTALKENLLNSPRRTSTRPSHTLQVRVPRCTR